MLVRCQLPNLLPRLCALRPSLAMSSATGTFTTDQPLNYRAGARVRPVDSGPTEDVYEPATGTRSGRGVEAVLRRGPVRGGASLRSVRNQF